MAANPSGQQQLGGEPSICSLVEKVAERVVATGAEPNDRATVGCEVDTLLAQHLNAGTRGKKCHNIARRQNYVKRFGDAARTQVELGEDAEEPARTGMAPLGRLDEHWVTSA